MHCRLHVQVSLFNLWHDEARPSAILDEAPDVLLLFACIIKRYPPKFEHILWRVHAENPMALAEEQLRMVVTFLFERGVNAPS